MTTNRSPATVVLAAHIINMVGAKCDLLKLLVVEKNLQVRVP